MGPPQAILTLSGVAGESIVMSVSRPFPALAAHTASFIAKNTELASRNGGSPTALLLATALGLGALCSRVTLNSSGMSFAVGILYVPGPAVNSVPGLIHLWSGSPYFNSSRATYPMP